MSYVFVTDVLLMWGLIDYNHLVFGLGDAKSEDTANKEAGEEKPEEDNDYHRSDEQVRCNRSRPTAKVLMSSHLQFAFTKVALNASWCLWNLFAFPSCVCKYWPAFAAVKHS